ncbi:MULTISPECIES: ABC transporter ATP-binding protein [Myroides]|uniref:Dipeptide ABC transporter ATP-binding protein n=1 Tax=Myroides albus TaxID=2562892 RepID=A0A6I3LKL1_9FLAO|nr:MULTISPECIES: ABC transporter ATP-binding protein [Myroides]MTG98046.1 dipeptide ABC transporter ATP-binding protein [Myroides albus]MVX36316.1 dipeptide ABC transporter ATP-binding protein [Myroides sp. LoEW2-1]UVD80773.1 ABC transporter ATP-binding protein [Myroides albus]
MQSKTPLLQVLDLEITTIKNTQDSKSLVQNCSFELYQNEILGIVGESGSGKSITSLAIMGLLPKGALTIANGSIVFNKVELTQLKEEEIRSYRGKEFAMIFQEPMTALNPTMTCGRQVLEILQQHRVHNSDSAMKQEVISLFKKVKLPNPQEVYHKYPHQLSGGQKQRIMIAMAISCKPAVLIADEPTTALDVTVQKDIVELLKSLQKETGMSIVFITHDLGLISSIADRVIVMYKGKIVEQGNCLAIFNNPKELYTQALIASRPSIDVRLKRLPTISDFLNQVVVDEIVTAEDRAKAHQNLYNRQPLLEIRNVVKDYIVKTGLFRSGSFRALDHVSFNVYEGETLGLVGESGCGKSTLGNAILQLDKATEGQIFYRGIDITRLNKAEIRKLRKEIQIIFQDPYSSLNPRITVGEAILEPMKVHKVGSDYRERKSMVIDILSRVGLDKEAFDRYPHEFSGGQRQRIGIARTIALNPKLIICDESVSALDISVQAQVLNLLNELKDKFGFTYIFISHDLAVVKYVSDQIVVMNKGKVEEINEADELYDNPQKDYTRKLISAIPK